VKNQKELNPVVDKVLKQEMQPLFGTNTAASLNSEFLAKNSAFLPHVVAGKKTLKLLFLRLVCLEYLPWPFVIVYKTRFYKSLRCDSLYIPCVTYVTVFMLMLY